MISLFQNQFKIGNFGASAPSSQPGELITGTYSTYHGPIDLMTTQISQDFDRSLDLLSETSILKAKFFRAKSPSDSIQTVLILLGSSADNITFVID